MDNNKSQKEITLNRGIFILAEIAEFILVLVSAIPVFPLFVGISIAIGFVCLNIFIYCRLKQNKILLSKMVIYIIISIILSILAFIALNDSMTVNVLEYHLLKKISFFAFLLIVFYQFVYCVALVIQSVSKTEKLNVTFREQVVYFIPLSFMFFFSVPVEYMVANPNDYAFNILDYFKMNFLPAIIVVLVLAFLSVFLNEKDRIIYDDFFIGLTIASYIQYMFFNAKMGVMDGHTFQIEDDIKLVIINTLIWIAVFVISFMFNKYIKYKRNIILAIMAIQLIALVTNIASNTNKLTGYNKHFFDYDETFTVGSDENIIMLCFDAVDNSFIKQLMDEGYDFSDFSDFNLFTNTCSVYDKTKLSVPQMLMADPPEGENDNFYVFYDRLKENGFTINLFNFAMFGQKFKLRKYINNYMPIPEDNKDVKALVDYKTFAIYSAKFIGYSFAPYIVKSCMDMGDIDFYTNVYLDTTVDVDNYYFNEDYYNSLNLKVSDTSDKYFMFNILRGAHLPTDSYIEDTKYCLEIAKEYIRQLKELGLYDNATILFSADHGFHDGHPGYPYPSASTPLFMIKRKGEKHEEMQLNNAPEYHTDILATLLDSAGLYEDNDAGYIGKSVFSYGENEKRTRTWYDMDGSGQICFKYEYDGDTSDLEYVVDHDLYDKEYEENRKK